MQIEQGRTFHYFLRSCLYPLVWASRTELMCFRLSEVCREMKGQWLNVKGRSRSQSLGVCDGRCKRKTSLERPSNINRKQNHYEHSSKSQYSPDAKTELHGVFDSMQKIISKNTNGTLEHCRLSSKAGLLLNGL